MKIPLTVVTFDATTGETVDTRTTEAVVMMHPVPTGVCEECGRKHEPDAPHDPQSLRYQYRFYTQHHRWPTWADAMAHCPQHVRMIWTDALAKRDIDVHGGAHE